MTNTDQLRETLYPIIDEALKQIRLVVPVENGTGIKGITSASDLLMIDLLDFIEQYKANAVRAASVTSHDTVSPSLSPTDDTDTNVAMTSPTIDTELDTLKDEFSIAPGRDPVWTTDRLRQFDAALTAIIERETARARIDELQMLTTKAYQLHEDAEYPKKIERYAENRINDLAALTSHHERKDTKK